MEDKQYLELRRSIRKVETMLMDIYDTLIEEKKMCPICKNRIRLYLPFGVKQRYNAQCPVCRSLERHRALWLFLEREQCLKNLKGMKVLHFAPESVFFNLFSQNEEIDYWPVDINPMHLGGAIRKVVDITDIPFEENSIDMIICNHVLEHILDEKRALSEMRRVLKDDGIAILTVPLTAREKTYENSEYNTPELRLKYFGQEDHVRVYGQDFADRIRKAQFMVDELYINQEYTEKELKNYGLFKNDRIWICRKKKGDVK